VATFYSQLEAVHDLARDEKPVAAAASADSTRLHSDSPALGCLSGACSSLSCAWCSCLGAGAAGSGAADSDADDRRRVAQERERQLKKNPKQFFKYEMVLRLLIANHALPHALGAVNKSAQDLAASIDSLYARVSDQHLHRLISAIVYVKEALKRASAPPQAATDALSHQFAAAPKSPADTAPESGVLAKESLVAFAFSATDTQAKARQQQERNPWDVARKAAASVSKISSALHKTENMCAVQSVLSMLQKRIFIHVTAKVGIKWACSYSRPKGGKEIKHTKLIQALLKKHQEQQKLEFTSAELEALAIPHLSFSMFFQASERGDCQSKLYFQPAAAYPDLDFGCKTSTSAASASVTQLLPCPKDGGPRGLPLSTFVLVGIGACTAGDPGVLWDKEADEFINTIKDRTHGQVWRLPSDPTSAHVDYIIKGLPTKHEKFSALTRAGLLDSPNAVNAAVRGPDRAAEETAYILTHQECTETDATRRRTIQRPRTAATYDFDPGSLTEMDTYADATLATLRSEARHGPPVPKQELPYMREWETRQMSSRSTGSGLSMASHVIPERLRHMTHLFNVLPSFAEDEDAPGLLAAGAGESATSRSWLGDFMPADGSWMVPGISAPQRSSGDAARITPSAASLRSSLTRGTPPQTAVSFFPSANEPGHSHSQPIVSFAADGGPGETPHARPGSVSVVSPGTQSVMSAEGKGLEQGDKGGGGGGDSGGGSGVISFSRRSF